MHTHRIRMALGVVMAGALGATLAAFVPLLLLSVCLLLFKDPGIPQDVFNLVVHHRDVSALIGAAIGAYWGWRRMGRLTG